MKGAANCLDLHDDDADINLLFAMEKAVSIEITDAEAGKCETTGQLYDVVWAKVRGPHEITVKCPSAVAFYRLRTGLKKCGFEGRISPDTDLSIFFRRNGAKKVVEAIRADTGLELPRLTLSALSTAILWGVLVLGTILSAAQASWLPVAVSAVAAIGFAIAVPKVLPDSVASMKDFTTNCAAWNYGQLANECGGARSRDVWNAFVFLVRESAAPHFKGNIDRETRFFPAR